MGQLNTCSRDVKWCLFKSFSEGLCDTVLRCYYTIGSVTVPAKDCYRGAFRGDEQARVPVNSAKVGLYVGSRMLETSQRVIFRDDWKPLVLSDCFHCLRERVMIKNGHQRMHDPLLVEILDMLLRCT